MAFTITSPAFNENAYIPLKYTCDGQNISPQLNWSNAPQDTKTYILIVDDPDAPSGTWVHWILFNIPSHITELKENIGELPPNSKNGQNSWGKNKYGGPCPPADSTHRYFFKLFALDTHLNLPDGATKDQIENAMSEHVLAQATLVGLYFRDPAS